MSSRFTKTRLFTPRTINRMLKDSVQFSDINQSSLSSSHGKRLEPNETPDSAFNSTKDLDLDWSKFENHTFFNSAESNVNTSFDIIVNRYPFDGDEEEHIQFFDNLTGYENYIYRIFPKRIGFLWFSNQLSSSISVTDKAGALYPSLSRKRDGLPVLDYRKKSFTVELQLYPHTDYTYDQIITQKLSVSQDHGFTILLSQNSNSPDIANVNFLLSSGSGTFLSASTKISKGNWHHLACQYDRKNDANRLRIFVSGSEVSTSENAYDFGEIDFRDSPLTIGSGSNHFFIPSSSYRNIYNISNTLTGAIDEFRIWHKSLNEKEITENMNRNIYASDDLKLYYKFNEATGSYAGNTSVIDHSGNSLHSSISNYSLFLRNNHGTKNPLSFENEFDNPILFPDNEAVKKLNQNLLTEAINYDFNNPSLIIKLIPRHYLQDSRDFENKSDEFGGVGDEYSYNTDFPGGGKMTSPQVIASLLYTWAKSFDEVKIYIDQFSKLINIDYTGRNIPTKFLARFARSYGVELPNLFSSAKFDQYHKGENLTTEGQINKMSLKKVQYEIWKRIVINLPHLLRSKGTMESIRGIIKASGINPDRNFRFKEFGGSENVRLTDVRKKMSKTLKFLDCSGSFSGNSPMITSAFLSGSRIEPGAPFVSNTGHDVLLTSGSFTFEATYRFDPSYDHPLTQSLARFYVTGSEAQTGSTTGIPQGGLVFHLMAFADNPDLNYSGSIKLYARPSSSPSIKHLELNTSAENIFDGKPVYVSFGRKRNDFINSSISSSYFLRCGAQSSGEISFYSEDEKLYYEGDHSSNLLTTTSPLFNASGSYFEIGNTTVSRFSSDKFLNNSLSSVGHAPQEVTTGSFTGQVHNVRYWTLPLSSSDSKEHVVNYESIGVSNPKINFNFVNSITGSYEKLRVQYLFDQVNTSPNANGDIEIFDFSQNNFHASGSGFAKNNLIVSPVPEVYTIIDPKYEEASKTNNVRIRGFTQQENVDLHGGSLGIQYHLPYDDKPVDDNRLSLEISLTQALDEDIINMFGTLDILNNSLGDPALMFSSNYKDFEILRDIYFNRLNDKINFKSFFEFFKWFDTNIGDLIDYMIPSNTNFLGSNFVVESHMLERHKIKYLQGDVYIGETDRGGSELQLLGQQTSLITRKF